MAPQLRNLFIVVQSNAGEARGDACTKPSLSNRLGIGRCAEYGAHFLLHAAPVGGGTAAQLFLHVIFQVTHYDLGHVSASLCYQ
jgi:hypothetical protein